MKFSKQFITPKKDKKKKAKPVPIKEAQDEAQEKAQEMTEEEMLLKFFDVDPNKL